MGLPKIVIPDSLKNFSLSPALRQAFEAVKNLPAAETEGKASSFIGPHPSVRTNKLLEEANAHAEEQGALLRKANELALQAMKRAATAEADAALARRAALLANIIAVIALAVAVKEQIVDAVMWAIK
jgi:hypothetical protein